MVGGFAICLAVQPYKTDPTFWWKVLDKLRPDARRKGSWLSLLYDCVKDPGMKPTPLDWWQDILNELEDNSG